VLPHQRNKKVEKQFSEEGSSPSMVRQKLFPCVLVSALLFGICSTSVFAQTRTRLANQTVDDNEVSCSPDDPLIISTAEVADSKHIATPKPLKTPIDLSPSIPAATGFIKTQPLLLAAIDQRLGAPYSWGAAGPSAFDCSGFVWSIFQSAGINFDRSSARALFARFAPPAPEEQYKFGTLVFFSGLAHVGVVADEHGFYHASRHHGVVYSPFNEYWVKRIDGFRRVPVLASQLTD
jgi:cell wall-associated NlpC family hydrolase